MLLLGATLDSGQWECGQKMRVFDGLVAEVVRCERVVEGTKLLSRELL